MNDKPYPYNEDQLAWLRDLETTEELQARAALREHDPYSDESSFCCLGRACVVLQIPCEEIEESFFYEGSDCFLPQSAVDKLRLRSPSGQMVMLYSDGKHYVDLAELNDDGWSFKKIAAYIRENPWNVFRDPEDAA